MKLKIAIVFVMFFQSIAIAQWVSHGSPKGGGIKLKTQINNTLFRASEYSVYKSTDGGKSWHLSSTGLPCNELIRDFKAHKGKLYAAISRNGIYVSDNLGQSWTSLNQSIATFTFYDLNFHEDSIYASWSERGFYKSKDLGANWEYRTIANLTFPYFKDFIVYNNKLYAAVRAIENYESDIYKSSDNGDTWVRKRIPGLNRNGVNDLEIFEGNVFASTEAGVFVSFDGMNSWEFKSFDNFNATVLSFDIIENVIYANTSQGTYFYSTDKGVNWTKVRNTNTQYAVNFIDKIGGELQMATNIGLFSSSNNGGSWQFNNSNNIDLEIKSLKNIQQKLYAITSSSVVKSVDNGNSWQEIINGLSKTNHEITGIGDRLILANFNGIYTSQNEGANWTQRLSMGINETPSVLHTDGNTVVTAVVQKGVYISQNAGTTWKLMNNQGLPKDTAYTGILVNGNSIIIGTHNFEVYKSDDLGNTWNVVSIGQPKFINSLKLIDGIVYASTFQGIMTSSDFGTTWNNFDNYNYQTYDLDIIGNQIYIATNQGVNVADLDDRIFYPYCEGLGMATSTQLLINSDVVFVGTWSKSIWKRKLALTVPPTEDQSTLGIDTIELCPSEGSINLFSKFGYQVTTEGTWHPNLSSTNGDFDPSIDQTGSYVFKYLNDDCGCENYLKFEVVVAEINAGNDTEMLLCTSEPEIDLLTKLSGNPSTNGVWNPALNSGTNMFNPSIDAAGEYTYTVSNSSCGTDVSKVTIGLTDSPNAGISTEIEVCKNSNLIDLTTSLKGSPDSGGIWSPMLNSASNLFNPSVDTSGTYTYTIGNGNCATSATISINVLDLLSAGENGNAAICTSSEPVNIFELLEGNPTEGGIWSPVLNSGTDLFDPKIDTAGIYEYTVSSSCGIETSQVTISIFEGFNFENVQIEVSNFSGQNNIEVIIEPNLTYEYSLDNENFQTRNDFTNLSGGIYTVYGREVNGCGYFEKVVSILDYPRFFTPNNDGINDTWKLLGTEDLTIYSIQIFDRFGKLLVILNEKKPEWNGTYNGNIMNSTDYWFKADLGNANIRGHFSLIR